MIIGMLISTIGLIPIVLALIVNRMYKYTGLSLGLMLFMILVAIWQQDVSVLFYKDVLPEQYVLFIFRVLRLAPTFQIPVVFYIAYVIVNNYGTSFKSEKFLYKVIQFIFTKKILIALTVWSSLLYMINWTDFSVKGLIVKQVNYSPIEFYFPEYGSLSWLFTVHISSFSFFYFFLFLIANKIHNTNVRGFLKSFTMYSFFLFCSGVLNFNPKVGVLTGSIGVLIFCLIIMWEFVKLNTSMQLHYFQIMERQKKLDFTGNLAGSLIHEVKNTNIIIKGFSKILCKDTSNLNHQQKASLDMIIRATEQVEELANNYKEYMKNSKMDFKMEDIGLIIKQSIQLSQEITNDNHVTVEFINDFKSLKALVNKTYLQQVFINLIKNSSEAIPADKEERKITINTELMDNMITINFFDTGRGIPLENWESIFDPFISFKDKGMGLGLPFVKKIIFEHRGDIVVADSTPAGTHFKITLPQFGIHDIHEV